jgi:uncharacterized protein (UPF0276 family)
MQTGDIMDGAAPLRPVPPLFVSWFPGCAEPAVLRALAERCGVEGVEVRYLDADAQAVLTSGLDLAFHLPTPPGEPVAINLVTEDILAPYRAGRMALVRESDAAFVGYHCGYSCERVQKNVGADLALSPTLGRQETAERMVAVIRELKRQTGKDVIIENLDYGPTGAMEYVCEPAFIRQVCEAAACGFLWDIAHALVSAPPLGLDEHGYMESFIRELGPLTREVHLNSPREGLDAHGPPTERELTWLRRLLRAGGTPHAVTLERDWRGLQGLDVVDALTHEVRAVRDMIGPGPGGASAIRCG